ncbi:COMM domain-containing protein [Polyangium sp. y55x31]|uniref:COMM domain-containing protein n=1 Tax=Polyangium sp. y55x31 TaxID=3042688 RepID=UPI00248279C6|nr:COMM domain-containing protein [Polyangium sp. y55x31]MDI1480862.1 COMM domain-containing protein [Polyangium sp. y55x31]
MTLPLFCLGGKAAPEAIEADLKTLARLPERARARFWDALGPALPDPLPASAESALDTFARAFDVPRDDLARALKASRFLVREACARGLDRGRFEEDVVRLAGGPLSPEAAVIAPILLSRYDAARAALGVSAFRDTLTDHGAVVESIEWRVDAVLASSRGDTGAAKIAVLTLGYRDGDRKDRITLHLSPEKLEELRSACERMSS